MRIDIPHKLEVVVPLNHPPTHYVGMSLVHSLLYPIYNDASVRCARTDMPRGILDHNGYLCLALAVTSPADEVALFQSRDCTGMRRTS